MAENLVAGQKSQTMLVTLDYEAKASQLARLVVVALAQAADAAAERQASALLLELADSLDLKDS